MSHTQQEALFIHSNKDISSLRGVCNRNVKLLISFHYLLLLMAIIRWEGFDCFCLVKMMSVAEVVMWLGKEIIDSIVF